MSDAHNVSGGTEGSHKKRLRTVGLLKEDQNGDIQKRKQLLTTVLVFMPYVALVLYAFCTVSNIRTCLPNKRRFLRLMY
jgi:hypothetical protein